jgi:hypothetical protein
MDDTAAVLPYGLTALPPFFFVLREVDVLLDRVLFLFLVDELFLLVETCSGSLALPVSRFHSSNVSAVISPFTNSSANFRR